jgi:hypothetical protein
LGVYVFVSDTLLALDGVSLFADEFEGCVMYMDETVIASLLVVLATLGVFVGLGVVIYKDIRKNGS